MTVGAEKGQAMLTTEIEVNSTLLTAVGRVSVDPGGLRARSGDHAGEAENLRELRTRLANIVYLDLHAGQRPHEDGELRPRSLRDDEFETRLSRVVPHQRAPFAGTVLDVPDAAEGSLPVRLPEAAVWLPVTAARAGMDPVPGATVLFDLPAIWPALSPGFLMVTGPHGATGPGHRVRRLYLHVRDPRQAPEIWGAALVALGDLGVRYRAKALSDPASYPRQDAIVIYGHAADTAFPEAVRSAVAGMPGLGHTTSPFTRSLAPGVSTALEPDDGRPRMRGTSFGQHRAMALATGLIAQATHGGRLEDALATALREANIDPTDPSENLTGNA